MICTFLYASLLRRGSSSAGPRGTSWVGELTLSFVSPGECRPCCEPTNLLGAVSSLVVTNCPKASGGLSHPSAISTRHQVPDCFSISKGNSNFSTRLYRELTEDSQQELSDVSSLYSPKSKTSTLMASM